MSETLSITAQRLIRWGASERESLALSRLITLERDTPEDGVEDAVITALVDAKQYVSGVADIEYLGGTRRDTLRLEK
jgi:hypothetical protein